MRRLWSILIVVMIMSLLVVPVIASTIYTSTVYVTESNGTSYSDTLYPFNVTVNNAYLANNGYQSHSGLGQLINGATPAVYGSSTWFLASPQSSSTTPYSFSVGNTDAASTKIITGNSANRSIVINDDAGIEPRNYSSIFDLQYNAYLTTTTPTGLYLVSKINCIAIYKSGSTINAYVWVYNGSYYQKFLTGTITTNGDQIIRMYSTDGVNVSLSINGVLQDTQALVYGINDSSLNWELYCYPYVNSFTLSVGGTTKVSLLPEYMIGTGSYSTGTISITTGTKAVTGSGTAFTFSLLGSLIKISTDAVYYTVTDVVDATHLTIDRNYAGATRAGVSYSITGNLLQDTTSCTYVGTITQGSNPSGIATSIDPLSSSYNTSTATYTTTASDIVQQDISMGGINSDDPAQSTNIFTPWVTPFSHLMNVPLVSFILIVSTVLLIGCIVWVMKKAQNQLVGSAVLITGEIFLWKLGIYQFWFVIVTFLVCFAIIIYERRPVM